MALPIEDYAVVADTQTLDWSARTGRSTGCAFPGSTTGRCSRRCWAPRSTGGGCLPRPAGCGGAAPLPEDSLILETEFDTDDADHRPPY
jgi:hypothetical protein